MGTIAAEKLLDMVLLAVCFIALLPLIVLPQELAARRFPIIGMTTLVMVLCVCHVMAAPKIAGVC